MNPTADAFQQDFAQDGLFLQPPPPPPPPPPPEVITRNFHHNARPRMAPKKPVVTQKCEICNIELNGQVVIDAHLKGSKHAKKLKAKELLSNMIDAGQVGVRVDGEKPGPFKCDLCNVSMNSSQQLDVHNAGAKHKAKLTEGGEQQEEDSEAAQPNEPMADGSSEIKVPVVKAEKPKSMIANPLDLVCTVCNVTVNSPQQLEQHLNSKKHKDREAGRVTQRPGPYPRGGRGGRGGLGSHGRGGGKGVSSKFTSLSSSFKSAGYSNSFIKPEGGVIPPQNCGPNKGPNPAPSPQHHAGKPSNFGGQFKNKGNFGSLTPYVNTVDNGRGGYSAQGVATRGGWNSSAAAYGTHPGYSGYDQYGDYEQYGYNYTGYENTEGYAGYGMVPPGPPPTY